MVHSTTVALLLLVTTLVSYYAIHIYASFQKNFNGMKSKLGGLHVDAGPVFIGSAAWQVGDMIFGPIFRLLPHAWTVSWLDVSGAKWSYDSKFRPYEQRNSDIIAVASPGGTYMSFANAEAISKICERRKDFVKPVEVYKIVDIFGTNVVTLEGEAWRRHRRVVAPAFTEKNNDLVWKESLYQVEMLLRVWADRTGNTPEDMIVKDLHPDAADFSLHVISRAGFGIRLKWAGQSEDDSKSDTLTGFSSLQPVGSHDMTFKTALKNVLEYLVLFALFEPPTMKMIPTQATQKVFKAWYNLSQYWQELLDHKLNESRVGSTKGEGMDLMLRFVEESGIGQDSKPSDQMITAKEIMGNAFILMLAGHETTANAIQNAFSFLAMNIGAQKRLQKEIDDIAGSTPVDKWDYKADCDRLFNSMVGAVINEQLRLMPSLQVLAKRVNEGEPDQPLTVDGRDMHIPSGTFIHLNAYGVHRNPRYWPFKPSQRTAKPNDLEDFVPERWLVDGQSGNDVAPTKKGYATARTATRTLLEPMRGSFVPFSDGQRGCIGRRFALVELTAVVASVFRQYSVELAVDEWASDEEVNRMGMAERRALYQKAIDSAWGKYDRDCEAIVTLRLSAKNTVPLRIVKRGRERFFDCFREETYDT